ncbi:NAD(P)/FAD-dependent oxidoreductase [Chloroflexota bacterium]
MFFYRLTISNVDYRIWRFNYFGIIPQHQVKTNGKKIRCHYCGIFAALELTKSAGLKILLLEKGKDIDQRHCPARDGSVCLSCSPCNLVCGLGGAGIYSDGKLVLSSQIGGQFEDYVEGKDAASLIKYVDDTYLKFGAPENLYNVGAGADEIKRKAALGGMRLIPAPIRHLGTERSCMVLRAMRNSLDTRLDLKLDTMAASIIVADGAVQGIETDDGERYLCEYLILAPGREGSDWLSREGERLGLTMQNNPVDVGVRVEVPAAVMESLTAAFYEVKLEYFSKSFHDRVRTFCMCPGGEVIMESTGGADPVITVNGHSYSDRKTGNTNFALLVSTDFTKPFHEPIAYGKYLARLANILSGGVLVQRLGDLMQGRRSTPERISSGLTEPTLKKATPGDLSFVLPYRHLTDLVEMLQAMDKLALGVASEHTLIYGVEVKFYSCRPQLNPDLETEVANMFAVGDGTGVSRGLVQASASGVVAAHEILGRSGY